MDKRLVLVLLAALLVVGWLWWSHDDVSVAAPATASADRPVADAASAAVAETGAARSEVLADRMPVAADAATGSGNREADAEPMGELFVQVVFADDVPAPRIHVYVVSMVPHARRPLAELVSDAVGLARTRVPAGKVLVQSDRGGRVEDEVIAGQQQQVRLQIPLGLDVEGVVRDPAGAPVPGALVWLTSHESPWCGGAFVGQADARGAFVLRAVPKQQSLGAVAPGFAPSKLVDLELLETRGPWGGKSAPVHVELVLQDGGGRLTGRVTDEQGQGIAGAIVAVGSSERRLDHRSNGTVEEHWAPRRAVTGADGRYAIEGLAKGEQPVEVWAREFPFWRGACTIEARGTAQLDITMLRGVTVHGVVTGEDGNLLAGAIVRAFPVAIAETFLQGGLYDYESTFGYASAVADAAGRYRLRRAPPGALHLYAAPGGPRGMDTAVPWATAVLQAQPGAVIEWNPAILPGPTIRGVVRYRDGMPMGDVFVSLLEQGKQRRQVMVADHEGRFRFVRLQKKAYDVSVQVWSPPEDAPPVEAREVWPDSGELEIRAAFDAQKQLVPGSVCGVVSDLAGRLRHPADLAVILGRGLSWNTNPKLGGGAFRFTDVEPGRMQVIVLSGEAPILFGPWFELQPAEQKDVGTLVTEPGGALLLTIVRGPGTEAIDPVVYVTPAGASHGRNVAVGQRTTEVVIDNLCAGEHLVSCYSKGAASIRDGRCTIVVGVRATATIELRAAATREIVVEYTAAQRLSHIRVQDERGGEHFEYRPRGVIERPYRMKVPMPLSRITLLVETEGGGKTETTFDMTSLAEGQPPVVLQAK